MAAFVVSDNVKLPFGSLEIPVIFDFVQYRSEGLFSFLRYDDFEVSPAI